MQTDTLAAEVPDLDLDPFSPEFLADRNAFYEILREKAAVVRLPKYNTYAIGRFEENNAVLRDYQNFTSTAGSGMADTRVPGSWREPAVITSIDPPVHTGVRKALNRILSPAVVKRWKETFDAAGEKLMAKVMQNDRFDIVKEVSETFVIDVFPRALGVNITREQALITGDFNFNALGPKNELFQQSEQEIAPLQDWLAYSRTRESLIPGGWAEQIFDAEADGSLPEGAASSIMLALLRGGMDTTISSIGSSFALLAEHPEQWRQLKADHSLIKGVFDQTIRLEAPIQSYYRTTARECELGGYRLDAGMKVQMFIGSANRDPRKWADPDNYDITQSAAGHLALGQGVHNCIGQLIARFEHDAVVMPFVRAVGNFRLAEPPIWRRNNMLNTLDRLVVEIERE